MSLNIPSYLSSGFSPEQISQVIEKIFPNVSRAMKSAEKSGKNIKDIIGMLARLTPSQLKQADKNAENLDFQSPLEKANAAARSQEKNEVMQGVKKLGSAALTAASIYGASKILPSILGATSSLEEQIQNNPYQSTISPSTYNPQNSIVQEGVSIPSQYAQKISGALPPSSPNIGPTPMSNAPTSNPPQVPPGGFSPSGTQQPLPTPQSPNTPQTSPSASSSNSINIINQMGIGPQIKSLQQAGNPPEAIAAAIGVSMKPHQKKWLDDQIKAGTAKPLADMITDVINQPVSNDSEQEPLKTEIRPEPVQDQQPEIEQEEVPEQKLEKGHLVATPNGEIGEVKSLRNGKALIDEEGNLHQAQEKDLISSPLPKKDLADLYQDLLTGIEEQTGEEVSRNVNIAAYNPETNKLLYQPHAGGIYIYANIPEEDKDLLTKFLVNRKTTGSSFMGAWSEGTKSPIGAGMSALIKRLQSERGGKGNEYEEKYDIIYEALKPAVEALKKRKRDEKKRKR